MPRKRTSDDTSSTGNTSVTPDVPASDTSIATADPPAAPEADGAGGRSFADRVGQKQRPAMPDPFGIAADYLAGVRLFESKQDGQMAIKFDEKPPQAVIDKMHNARWIWKRSDGIWAYPVRSGSALTTRINAEELFQEVRHMIRKAKGFEPSTRDLPT